MKTCANCGYDVETGAKVCPNCAFDPKSRGLLLTGYVLAIGPILWILAIVSMPFLPTLAAPLMIIGAGFVLLCGPMYIVSMAATPYRFGRLFLLLGR
ncbi:MAG: hypothetical protein ACLFM8_00405 [Halobacteriales archaeon]